MSRWTFAALRRHAGGAVHMFLKSRNRTIVDTRLLEAQRMCESNPLDVLRQVVHLRTAMDLPTKFVQIGANDGVYDDNLRPLVVDYGMRGLMVEPQPDVFRRLEVNTRNLEGVAIENVAVAASSGTLALYRFKNPSGDTKLHLLSTADRTLLAAQQARYGIEAEIETLDVPAVTLDALLRKHRLQDASFFVIDTEGFDAGILRQIDMRRRPVAIQFEHRHLAPESQIECYRHLTSHGYGLVRCRKDSLAVLPLKEWTIETSPAGSST